jgi:GST-like protein
MLELYTWNTDNGHKARQAMEETGLAHEIRPVALPKREQFSPEYMKISPGHKIPALVDTDGPGGARITLCESGAILKYLGEKAGGTLYPSDPLRRVQVDQWLFYGSATFTTHAQQYGLFMHRFGEDVPPAKKHYKEQVLDMFGIFDRHLAGTPYMAGDYSMADISIYPDVHIHGKLGMGLADFPNLERWHDAIAARPAVQRAWVPL